MRLERCDNCGSWQRKALDFGHCWSGDRLDDMFSDGPADLTYPADFCEEWWAGSFDAEWLRSHGGNPDADYAGGPGMMADPIARQFIEDIMNEGGR